MTVSVRSGDWFSYFRKNLTATQAAETAIVFQGAGKVGDGTYDKFDTNEETAGVVPQGENRVLNRLGFYFGLHSDAPSVRDAVVKLLGAAVFTLTINSHPVVKEMPLALFPAGVGFTAESQDTVTAGKDLWFQMGNGDPRSMRPFAEPFPMPAGTTYKMEIFLEGALSMTTAAVFSVYSVFWGKRASKNVA